MRIGFTVMIAALAVAVAGCSTPAEKPPAAKPEPSASPTLPPGALVMPDKQPKLAVLKEVSPTKGDKDLGEVTIPPGKEFWVDFACSGTGKAVVQYAGTAGKFDHSCGGPAMRNKFDIGHPEKMPFRVDVPDDAEWALRVQQ